MTDIIRDQNTNTNIKVEDTGQIVMKQKNSIDNIIEFKMTSMLDDKKVGKMIKAIEKIVRESPEYRTYLANIISEYNLTTCSILGNVENKSATIEMHHYPFTLYDIVLTLMIESVAIKQPFTSFSLARKVLKLHYDNNVGLVPLSKTVHQLVHQSGIFINLKQTFGNIETFVNTYKDYIPLDLINKYNELVDLSEKDDMSKSPNVLKIDMDYSVNGKLIKQ